MKITCWEKMKEAFSRSKNAMEIFFNFIVVH